MHFLDIILCKKFSDVALYNQSATFPLLHKLFVFHLDSHALIPFLDHIDLNKHIPDLPDAQQRKFSFFISQSGAPPFLNPHYGFEPVLTECFLVLFP